MKNHELKPGDTVLTVEDWNDNMTLRALAKVTMEEKGLLSLTVYPLNDIFKGKDPDPRENLRRQEYLSRRLRQLLEDLT